MLRHASARELALSMASHASKRLHVLSAYDYDYPVMTELPSEMEAKIREEAVPRTDQLMEQKLAEYVAPLKETGLEVSKILRFGSPRETIVQVARDIEADVLIIGSHSKRGILDIVLGGTAQSVSRRAPCTVVLVSSKA